MPNTCLQLSLQASHKAVVQASVLRLLLQQLASTSPLAALVLRLSKIKCGLPVGAWTLQVSPESETAAGVPGHCANVCRTNQ